MHEDLGRFVDATSYFVLGSYGEEERPRLESVRDQLANEAAPASGDDDVDAFLMDEILDISEFFTSKFKLLVSYADHIVGVYEHSQGGHAWEAGYIDQPALRQQFVTIEWMDQEFGVPLSQLEPVEASADTEQAVSDWHYWLDR
jgi:hypothetical protein